MTPASDCLSNARSFVQEIRRNPPDPLIDHDVRQKILAKWPEITQVDSA